MGKNDMWDYEDESSQEKLKVIFKKQRYIKTEYSLNEYTEMLAEIEQEMKQNIIQYIRLYRTYQRLKSKLLLHADDVKLEKFQDDVHVSMVNDDIMLLTFDHILPMFSAIRDQYKKYYYELKSHYTPRITEMILTFFRKKSPILKECEGANSTNE